MAQPLIRMVNICKRFGSIQALDGVNFEAEAGETHVILGENGAGKSSLMSVLVGLYQPDQGEVCLDGKRATIQSPADALRLGIAIVPQHVELVAKLSVWENVILGREGPGWLLDRRGARAAVRRLIDQYELRLDPDAAAGQLSAGQQQKVEILKVLYRRARILILDEPTTFLTPQEADALYDTLTLLSREGMTIMVVTHKLRDALKFARRLTVMRAGRVEAVVEAAAVTEQELVQLMMGTDAESSRRLMAAPSLPPLDPAAPALLRLSDLVAGGGPGRVRLDRISLAVRAGEIYGIAGVTGSGQRELAEAVLGLIPVEQGRIRLGEQEITGWPVFRRLRAGATLIPEDRVHDGILPAMRLFENLVLGQHREIFPGLGYHPETAAALAGGVIAEYDVKAPGAWVPVAYLSGGNMQKVIVARAVQFAQRHRPALVIAANPTRGLDVRTVRQVHDRLRAIAAEGGAVLLISEDLDELMAQCHSISAIYQGAVAERFTGPHYDRYRIGEAMLGRRRREVPA